MAAMARRPVLTHLLCSVLALALLCALGLPAGAATGAWTQQAELIGSGGGATTQGWSVDVSGSTAVVGQPFCFHQSCSGDAFVFVKSGPSWTQQATLIPSDATPNEQFGRQLAIDGQTIAVGVPGKNQGSGVVYVFVRTGTTWTQMAELTDPDGTSGTSFGSAIALDGSTMLVASSPNGNGTVHVLTGSGSTWTQQAELADPDGPVAEGFGTALAISGRTALVGAMWANAGAGAAWVFVRTNSVWHEQAELTANDELFSGEFGESLALAGTDSGVTAVVGAPTDPNGGPGRAYVFAQTGTAWVQQAELASGQTGNDWFGFSVAISGSTALIGAYYSSPPPHAGTAYVYTGTGGVWSLQATLTASDQARYDNFGFSVALYRTTAVIGAPGHGSVASSGASYVFAST
jgi:hypothetical protein